MRKVTGRTDRVVVVGAGLGGLACAARMAAEVTRACGPVQAAGYLRFVSVVRGLWRLERDAPRTQRLFSFQSLYAGVPPHRALALYVVISYLDTVTGVYFPRGGVHAAPQALAGAAEKHGVMISGRVAAQRVTGARS